MSLESDGVPLQQSQHEAHQRELLYQAFKSAPIPPQQLLSNIGLFIESKDLARILLMDHLFRQIVDVHGCVMEFGSRWGQNAALFSALRGIYDPFNRHRKVVAFDSFAGFPSVHANDGKHEMMKPSMISTSKDYDQFLAKVLALHEQLNPMSHVQKFEVCKGDCMVTVVQYLEKHPETIIALAYFDFDIYEPTKKVLNDIAPRLTKGSVVAFDELNDPASPGETVAVMEALGLSNIRLKKYRYASRVSYFVVE